MSRIRLFLTVGALIGFILIPAEGATDEQLEQLKAQINAEIGTIKMVTAFSCLGTPHRRSSWLTLNADQYVAEMRGQLALPLAA